MQTAKSIDERAGETHKGRTRVPRTKTTRALALLLALILLGGLVWWTWRKTGNPLIDQKMELALQQEKAKLLRADIVKMTYLAKSGHPGGSLSCVEMLMALYYNIMKVDPSNPGWEERDRFVLSKGHACPALYAVLADKGYFPREDLWTLRKFHSHLQGHPDMRKTPGVDANTGSLGQGVSIAGGMALAAKHKGESHRVFVITGDGESQEGLVWEAAMSAAHYKLDNLTVLLDHNGLQIHLFNCNSFGGAF